MVKRPPIQLENISALAELERCGIQYQLAGEEEVKLLCPCHPDTTPSLCLNIKKNIWICHAASCTVKKGDIVSLIAYTLKCERHTVLVDLETRYDLGIKKTLSQQDVETWHNRIWATGVFLKELHDRGVTDDLIRKARLGFNEGRITIPVYDEAGDVINIRKYLPGAPGKDKMRNVKGHSGTVFYQADQLKYDVVWICGGELKALVAGSYLNEIGIGAVAVTGGEGAWDPRLTERLKGKTIYICLDIDIGGLEASRKIASQIDITAKAVFLIKLPLDAKKYPKGDINDWVGHEHAGIEDFRFIINSAERYTYRGIDEDKSATGPISVRLADSTLPRYIGHTIQVTGMVQALDTTPYLVPKEVRVFCDRKQPGCDRCPIKGIDVNPDTGGVNKEIAGCSIGMLSMISVNETFLKDGIRKGLKIPKCKSVSFTVRSHHKVFDARLTSPLQISGDNSDNVLQESYIVVEKEPDLNVPYVLTGRVYPSPKTQKAVLVMDQIEAADDSLKSFAPKENELQQLKVFQPSEWTADSVKLKLTEIYDQLETAVTRIFDRKDLHLVLDLTYHSVLYFRFKDRIVHGWVNSLIAGDSSQGKSEASTQVAKFYGLGTRHDCKNASEAGLLGGLKEMGKRWFVSWGVIPIHDRQLVFLEELKGMATESIGKLTDMRTSGVAELTKIEKRRAHARTRLVMISNPRSNRGVASYAFGIQVIPELIGALEDVRRFDIALLLSADQVDTSAITERLMRPPVSTMTLTSDLFRRAVLFAWTRTPEQVMFDDGIENFCIEEANKLCNEFTEVIPLIDQGTTRFKVARLSIALAIRTFSTQDTDPNVVLVRRCHVVVISDMLRAIYNNQNFGYKDFSQAVNFSRRLSEPGLIEKKIEGTKYAKDTVEHFLHTEQITDNDVRDWLDLPRDDAQSFLSMLVRKHAVQREKNWYVKAPEFIRLLKKMKSSGTLKNAPIEHSEDKF